MAPRDAVWSLLNGDDALRDLGGDGFVAIPQFDADQAPAADAFIVICWRPVEFNEDVLEIAEHNFDLYVHLRRAVSTDFGRIDNMIDRCDELFGAVAENPPVVGGDGWQLGQVNLAGRGPDFADQGYKTICRQASYVALGCKTTE